MDSSSNSPGSTVTQDSSSSSSSTDDSSIQQHAAAAIPASCDSIFDPRLHLPLLCHPSISEDQQAVAALQQTSKQLQAAVTQLLPGQLPVVLHVRKPQQAENFAEWLQKHAKLLRKLSVHVADGSKYVHDSSWRPAAVSAMAAALQQAAAAAAPCPLQLQSINLTGAMATADLLQQLPAAQLTQLCAEADMLCRDVIDAVQQLTALRYLALYNRRAAGAHMGMHADTPYPLALKGLQQLTALRLEQITPLQLPCMGVPLPPELQQIHVEVDVCERPEVLALLAKWLEQHASVVSTLAIRNVCDEAPAWQSAWHDVRAALAAAASTDAALSTTHGRPPAATEAPAYIQNNDEASAWQLQSFSAYVGDQYGAALLQHLPASSLTKLGFKISWGNAGHLQALCGLTALRSLQISSGVRPSRALVYQSDRVLAPLSALQRLTSFQFLGTDPGACSRKAQLQYLRLPQLEQLQVTLTCNSTSEQLLLSHLTAVTQLSVDNATGVLSAGEQLPASVRELTWSQDGGYPHSIYSLQPMLTLRCLQKLQMQMRNTAPAAEELAQITSIGSLTAVELKYSWQGHGWDSIDVKQQTAAAAAAAADAAAAVWLLLPLKALSWSSDHIPAAVVQHLGALQGLTRLELHMEVHLGDWLKPVQLADMLQPLTGLQQLKLASERGFRCEARDFVAPGYAVADVATFLQAIGGLWELRDVFVQLHMEFSEKTADQLYELLPELLPDWLAQLCQLQAGLLSIDSGAFRFTCC